MTYASLADVQGRVPDTLWAPGPSSKPDRATVEAWLVADSRWVETTLRWKYDVPVADPSDAALLQPIVAALVAAKVWSFLGGHNGQVPGSVADLRREALTALAYDAKCGRSYLVLPNSDLSDSGEAAQSEPLSSFTDPNAGGVPPRFKVGRDDW